MDETFPASSFRDDPPRTPGGGESSTPTEAGRLKSMQAPMYSGSPASAGISRGAAKKILWATDDVVDEEEAGAEGKSSTILEISRFTITRMVCTL